MRRLTYISLLVTIFSVPAEASTLRLEIRHLWNGEPLSLSGPAVTTEGSEQLRFSRLAYLLSEPGLVCSSRGSRLVKKDWVAYVDAENAVSELLLSDLPSGHYTELEFYVGLDAALDESDPSQYGPNHPLNPLLNNLHWDPQGGYIFVALEGHAEEGLGFSYHLGGVDNRVCCRLPISLGVEESTTIAIDFHLDRMFGGEEPWITQAQTSTHSRAGDPVAALMASRMPDVFSVREIRAGGKRIREEAPVKRNLTGTPYEFKVKKGFPIPDLPTDYPLTHERVALGEALFHETRLSKNSSLSCASCHQSEHAFADPEPFSVGVNGETGNRNSMPLFNLAWKDSFFWDGRAGTLREQAVQPIEDHLEMDDTIENVVAKLSSAKGYLKQFEEAFGTSEISGERIGIAIEQFLLTLTSYDSKFDRARAGEVSLSEQETRGLELFMTEFDPRRGLHGADCFHCHGGPFFSLHRFHNNGLELLEDMGLMHVSESESDRGKFVTPSLRNVALTAPYMHDGRFETLEEVIEHYTSGVVRTENLDPNLSKHPASGIPLSEEDKGALVAFLKTLTDEQFVASMP